MQRQVHPRLPLDAVPSPRRQALPGVPAFARDRPRRGQARHQPAGEPGAGAVGGRVLPVRGRPPPALQAAPRRYRRGRLWQPGGRGGEAVRKRVQARPQEAHRAEERLRIPRRRAEQVQRGPARALWQLLYDSGFHRVSGEEHGAGGQERRPLLLQVLSRVFLRAGFWGQGEVFQGVRDQREQRHVCHLVPHANGEPGGIHCTGGVQVVLSSAPRVRLLCQAPDVWPAARLHPGGHCRGPGLHRVGRGGERQVYQDIARQRGEACKTAPQLQAGQSHAVCGPSCHHVDDNQGARGPARGRALAGGPARGRALAGGPARGWDRVVACPDDGGPPFTARAGHARHPRGQGLPM